MEETQVLIISDRISKHSAKNPVCIEMSNVQSNLQREGTEDHVIALYYSTGTPLISTPPLNPIASVSLIHNDTVTFWVLVTSLLSKPRLVRKQF